MTQIERHTDVTVEQPGLPRIDRAKALWRVAEAVSIAEDADDALARGAHALVDALGPGIVGWVLLCDGTEMTPVVAEGSNTAAALDRQMRLGAVAPGVPLPDGPAWLCAAPPSPEDVFAGVGSDCHSLLTAAFGPSAPTSLLFAPLVAGQTKLGSLLLAGGEGTEPLTEEDSAIVQTIARLMAVAVDRANLQKRVEETGRLNKEAVSILSHQMRTPLAVIKGHATALLLQERKYDEQTRREFLETIDQEVDKLTKLVGDLLESSALEAGLLEIEPQPVLLPRLAQKVVKQIAQQSPAHQFVVSFPPDFPILHADPGRIEQVLHNLLDNAAKYSPDGGLVALRGTVDDAEVTISVADQGVGIAPEHLNRLFERFYRIKGNLRPPVAGTGLGLPIAHAIVETHGGRIWAESALGRGAAFYFTLPRQNDEMSGK